MKNVYFLADAHLGSLAIPHQRMQERRLVRFLDSIKEKAAAIYLLGDMFDFWNEYRHVVPKGYTRFLGKLSELTDMGVEVHYFTAACSTLLMAMVSAILTASSSACAGCSTTRSASAC